MYEEVQRWVLPCIDFRPVAMVLVHADYQPVAVAAAAAAAVSLLAAHHSHGRTIATFPGIERDTENQSQSSQDMIHGHAFHVPIGMQWRMGVGYGAANVLSTNHGVP